MILKAQRKALQAIEDKEKPGSEFARVWDFLRDPDEECLATFWRQATPGTTYWRCYLPAKYLPGQVPNFGEGLIEYDEETKQLHLHDQRGAAVWQFLGDDGRGRFALEQHRQGVPSVMELDDNYLVRPTGSGRGIWTKTHAEAMERIQKGQGGGGYSIEAHKRILPQLDGIIASTEYLADVYDAWNDNVFVCENSVDPTDWNVERTPRESPVFGYYGSAGHARDWATMKKPFKKLIRNREWCFIGYSPPGWTGLKAPWADSLMAARQNLGMIDIGVCPLNDDNFSRCKSDIKAMEYAMAGVLPIVSRTEPYRWWWEEMRWPWVAQTEAEWAEVLNAAARLSAEEVADVAAQAKALVLEHRTIQGNIHKWLEVIDFVS